MEELVGLFKSINDNLLQIGALAATLYATVQFIVKAIKSVQNVIQSGFQEVQAKMTGEIEELKKLFIAVRTSLDDSIQDRRGIHEELGRLDARITILEESK